MFTGRKGPSQVLVTVVADFLEDGAAVALCLTTDKGDDASSTRYLLATISVVATATKFAGFTICFLAVVVLAVGRRLSGSGYEALPAKSSAT